MTHCFLTLSWANRGAGGEGETDEGRNEGSYGSAEGSVANTPSGRSSLARNGVFSRPGL